MQEVPAEISGEGGGSFPIPLLINGHLLGPDPVPTEVNGIPLAIGLGQRC